MNQFQLKLAKSYFLAPSVRHMAFEKADGAPLPFIPGQFLQVHFAWEGKALKRSYSIATKKDDAKNPAQHIEMAISYVSGGAATHLFSNLQEGDAIDASGPYGRFCLNEKDENRRYFLIATGTGVTPYRAMLHQLRERIAQKDIEVFLLFGSRTPVEELYGEEFIEFAAHNSNFRFISCFSREGRAVPRADDCMGYVQSALPNFSPDPQTDIAYLCGNPNMVDTCFNLLKERGLPIPNIRREKYISPPDPKKVVAEAL